MKYVFEIQPFSFLFLFKNSAEEVCYFFPTSSYANPVSKNFYHLINKTCAFFSYPSHSILCYQFTILITLISSQMSTREKLYPGRNLPRKHVHTHTHPHLICTKVLLFSQFPSSFFPVRGGEFFHAPRQTPAARYLA